MWLLKTLSSIGFRNPFKRGKKDTDRNSQLPWQNLSRLEQTDAAAKEQRERQTDQGASATETCRQRNKKSACSCCLKPFTKFEQFLTLGERTCTKCKKTICKVCAKQGRCHICIIKGSVNLEPQSLMRANETDLITILRDLHCPDADLTSLTKRNLVGQILFRTVVDTEWTPTSTAAVQSTTTQVEVHSSKNGENPPSIKSRAAKATTSSGEDRKPVHKSSGDTLANGNPAKQKTTNNDKAKGEKSESQKGQLTSEEDEAIRSKMQKFLNRDSKDVSDVPSEDLCKICFDSRSDCILIDCGHMVTCSCCSELIDECPICRQPILRVIKV